jgi:hypothetical protein
MKHLILFSSLGLGCDSSSFTRPELDAGPPAPPPPPVARDASAPDTGDAHVCGAVSGGRCIDPLPGDFDADGWLAEVDCDDMDRNAYPGAPESRCNFLDEDCDGADYCPVDRDGDGEGADSDCDDGDPRRSVFHTEVPCSGVDEDCSGFDECDADGDDYYTPTDCDDTDPGRHPSRPEVVCDAVDQDCNGEDCCDGDFDGDGVRCADDCDDRDQFVYPGAAIPSGCVDEARDFDCDGDFDGIPCP